MYADCSRARSTSLSANLANPASSHHGSCSSSNMISISRLTRSAATNSACSSTRSRSTEISTNTGASGLPPIPPAHAENSSKPIITTRMKNTPAITMPQDAPSSARSSRHPSSDAPFQAHTTPSACTRSSTARRKSSFHAVSVSSVPRKAT